MASETLYWEILRRQEIEYIFFGQDLLAQEASSGVSGLTGRSSIQAIQGESAESLFEEFVGLEDDLKEVQQRIRSPFAIELVRRNLKDGREGYFTFSVSPFEHGLLLIIEDVTAEGQKEQQFAQQNNKLKLMNHRLETVRNQLSDLLRHFLPKELASELPVAVDRTFHSNRRQVTVIYASLRGFAPKADQMEDDRLFRWLDVTLGSALKTFQANGGVFDKYGGDAVIGLFNVDKDDGDHAEHAVRAAWDFIQAVRYDALFNFGVSVVTGSAVIGQVTIGDETKYTAAGQAVQQAQQLEELAELNQLLLSSETHSLVQNFTQTKRVSGGADADPYYELSGLNN